MKYEVRETEHHKTGDPCFYVRTPGKPLHGNNRISVFFQTRAEAERCVEVLIADDLRIAAQTPP